MTSAEPDPAVELAAALQEFADVADLGGDPRPVEATVTGPAGLPLPATMTASTAAWIAEILRRETAAIGRQIANPQDDAGYDVWGK